MLLLQMKMLVFKHLQASQVHAEYTVQQPCSGVERNLTGVLLKYLSPSILHLTDMKFSDKLVEISCFLLH